MRKYFFGFFLAIALILVTASYTDAQSGSSRFRSDPTGVSSGTMTVDRNGENLTVSPDATAPRSFVQNLTNECTEKGNCTICDGIKLLATIMQWILATVAGLALFFIIDGGFSMLTSAGNPEKIDAGKKKILGSIIGVIIVLGAWTLINAIIGIFAFPTNVAIDPNAPPNFQTSRLFQSPTEWSRIRCR